MISLAAGAGRPRVVSAWSSTLLAAQDPSVQQHILRQVPGCPSASVKDHIFIERVVETGADQPGGDIAEQQSPGPAAGRHGKQQEQAVVQHKTEQRAGCKFTDRPASGYE